MLLAPFLNRDVLIYPDLEPIARRTRTTLSLSPDPHHSAGSIRWDTNRPHLLYASSEPQNDELDGVHKVFDVNKGKAKLTFNVTTAGDAMAVDRGRRITSSYDKFLITLFPDKSWPWQPGGKKTTFYIYSISPVSARTASRKFPWSPFRRRLQPGKFLACPSVLTESIYVLRAPTTPCMSTIHEC